MQTAVSYGQIAPPFCITSGVQKFQQQKEIIRRNLSASCSSHMSHEADVVLTKRDVARGETLLLLAMGVISPDEARGLLRVSRSQVYKLLARYRQGGVAAISSKKCGVPSNRSLPRSFRKSVLEIIKRNYQDFGPTLVSEMLEDFHGIKLSVETLRQWMIAAKIWFADRAKRRRIHRPRNRMNAYGDLLQIDGSSHDWFEGRGPSCTLMVMIDDATGL